MSSAVTVTYQADIAVVTVTNPPVNALSHAVRAGLFDAVDQVAGSDARAAVLICDGRTFIAGADIREFDQVPQAPDLNTVINAIEASPKPWIAAIHGTALGGGLEVALGCHYRVAVPSAKMGLPEVNLGLVPGAGGTQRLPRIVGAAAAVKMVTGGVPVLAAEAEKMGLIARVAEGDLLDAGLATARWAAGKTPPTVTRAPATPAPSQDDWAKLESGVAKKAKGQLSPLAGLECVRDAFLLDLDEGLKAERARFVDLRDGDQSAALRYAFFAERAVAKPAIIKGAEPSAINRVAVVGGGLMGSGIATSLLLAGYPVVMVEMNEEASAAGRERVEGNLASAVKRGKMTADGMAAAMDSLTSATSYDAVADCDLAIEAVFEDLDVKRRVFAQLQDAMGDHAILATNTSYIDPNLIAEGIRNPERIIGMHFFSPAHVMKLCEVVKADATAPEVIASAFQLAKRMGKVAALSGVCEGFIGNRILAAYRRVCTYMMEDIRAIEPIDKAMVAFGLPMGPFQLMDLAGLQIGWATRKRLAPMRDPNERYSEVPDMICEAGRFGQKTGAGWYRYEKGDRTPISDPFVADAIEKAAEGRPKLSYSMQEIQDRALAVMVNEGAHILTEGIAARPLDIDMVKLFGYGFPRWWGGPMKYADIVGVDKVLTTMELVLADDPGSWTISPLLREAAADSGFGPMND